MSYRLAIESNNVIVKEEKYFGSYQGTWMMLLEDNTIVEGAFGSCSHCDAFQSEFNYYDKPYKQSNGLYQGYDKYGSWSDKIAEEEAVELEKIYNQKLKDFGSNYLKNPEPLNVIIERYKRKCEADYAWDDDKKILDWLISTKDKYEKQF